MAVTHIYIRPDVPGTIIDRALTSAARVGFDPRDSHAVQSEAWLRAWARRERRLALQHAARLAAISQATDRADAERMRGYARDRVRYDLASPAVRILD